MPPGRSSPEPAFFPLLLLLLLLDSTTLSLSHDLLSLSLSLWVSVRRKGEDERKEEGGE
jgi:hypothetical protein